MKKSWLKAFLPIIVIAGGVAAMFAIEATGSKAEAKKIVDTRPTVKVESVQSQDYQVVISGFGEVAPLERTYLSAQVSGEVVAWHENFVPGGLIKRGEVLFRIEKANYEAALMQAQAALALAEAALIEEQARAEVAKKEALKAPQAKITDLYLRKPQLLSAQAALKSAQAQLKIAERDLSNCEVKAPYDALVVARELGTGQYLVQGARVAEIFNIEYAEITFPVAGFDAAFLPFEIEGRAAEVVIEDSVSALVREAVLVRDIGVIDNSTRMNELVARVKDPYGLNGHYPPIKFGSYAEVSFVGKTLENVYRLPQELVNNQTVWVLGSDQKLESRKVAVLREEGKFFLIGDGLHNNDQVILTLPEYPQVGMEVKLGNDKNPEQSAEPATDTRSPLNS